MLEFPHMKFSLKIGDLSQASVEAILTFAWEDGWSAQTEGIDREIGGILKKEVISRGFEAKPGKILLTHSLGKIPAEKVFLVGLGKKDELTPYQVRKIFAGVFRRLKEEAIATLAFANIADLDLVQAAVEGFLLGSYKFLKYKSEETKEKQTDEVEVTIFVKDANQLVSAKEKITRGEIFSEATIFARDLVNEPASVTTPTYLANLAQKLGKTAGFSCKIYEKEQLEKLGMGAFLGVARGSDEPAKFIKLEYKNGRKKIVLVGKGITFDTGGLSLKKQEEMQNMKMDMAGAAAILAIFSVIDKIRPKVHLIGLLPATENMPSGKALKPGDIVKALSGKTIEVVNTDAEGRLILADALSFGTSLKPDLMIDLATLTGACRVALGEEIAGIFSTEEEFSQKLKEAAWEVGEKFWQMPLEIDYKELLKSEIADIKNITGKKYGGAITAALFLQEFVGITSWIHLDIAGPAWQEKETDLIPQGGSGFGVRTILNFLANL
ncbi:MAG: leucyl aminopeptidase [Microgenomates group bacterium LiPW_16]|nr:MAG: leucyl aminopeptidase [Microgenomates group bacterium LiPW_16]